MDPNSRLPSDPLVLCLALSKDIRHSSLSSPGKTGSRLEPHSWGCRLGKNSPLQRCHAWEQLSDRCTFRSHARNVFHKSSHILSVLRRNWLCLSLLCSNIATRETLLMSLPRFTLASWKCLLQKTPAAHVSLSEREEEEGQHNLLVDWRQPHSVNKAGKGRRNNRHVSVWQFL